MADDLIKLVKTYRLTEGLADRVRLVESVFRRIEPDLRFFVFHRISPPAGQDALQEVLKGVAAGIEKFKGGTEKEFWGWCYGIARNKMADYYRKKAADRMLPMPPDDLWEMIEVSAEDAPISPGVQHDLEHIMKLLTATKPDCNQILWRHYIIGLDYTEIAEERGLSYDNVRMKIGRCMEEAQALVQ